MLQNEDKVIKFGTILIGAFIAVFVLWMGFAPLDSAAVAPGKIVVSSNKKLIQHLEGGVVEKIYVKDGDVVKAGDLLIEIKNAQLNSTIDILKNEYLQNSVIVSRLQAQRDGNKTITWADDIKNEKGFELAASGQESIFNEQNKLLNDEISILKQRIDQLQNQIEGTRAIVSSRTARVA